MSRSSELVPEEASWEAPEAADGERIDRHVADHLGVARNQVQKWIGAGRVLVDGEPVKPATSVRTGDRIEAEPPPKRDETMQPEEGPVTMLHTDSDVIVVDKEPGVVVHPGAGHRTGTLAHRLLYLFPEIAGVGGPGRPGIVHRLDKGTSGVMVVARSERAYRHLSAAFAERRVDKTYLAVVYGAPASEGTIDEPIGRHRHKRQEMTVRPGGRPAVTHYETVAAHGGIALVEVELGTGRTHQIRVHLKDAGHPLVGDPTYGEARWKALPKKVQPVLSGFDRPALHAWKLAFDHPAGTGRVAFTAPVPGDLVDLWQKATGTGWPPRLGPTRCS